jgi:hypothetical protein
MNRVKLVTMLATVLVAASASVAASAETFFVEGVWSSEYNRFYFPDDKINNRPTFGWPLPSVAQLIIDDYGLSFSVHLLDSPYYSVLYSDYSRESYRAGYYSDFYGSNESYSFSKRDEYGNTYHTDQYLISFDRWGGGGDSGNIYTKEMVKSTLLSSGIGIFDLEQSFIYFEDGSNMSFTGLIASLVLNPHNFNEWNVTFTTDSIVQIWCVGYAQTLASPITGVTLAYNLPVPEPETWAMLLAGLGVIGTVARRRKVNVN